MDRRQLSAVIGHVATLVSATFLIIWGVFNLTIAINVFVRQRGDLPAVTVDWLVMFGMAMVFGLIPFLCGSVMLYRSMTTKAK